jgi:hypothetical protein
LEALCKSGYLSIPAGFMNLKESHAAERKRKSLWAVNLGVGVNILLAVIKTTFGIVFSDAVDNI